MVYSVVLQFSPARQRVVLRELCGRDELAVEDAGTPAALGLLNRLLVNRPEAAGESVPAEKIATADRDRLLAAVYTHTYGPRISSTVHCRYCPDRFDLDFSLDDLVAHTRGETDPALARQTGDGSFRAAGGYHFRLPDGADELAVLGLGDQQAEQVLLQRCLLAGNPASDGAAVQQLMAQIAPVLQTEMGAVCPECSREQNVHFDMQSFLLTRLRNDQPQVAWEVHRVATAYRWAHHEILDLPRRLRRTYVSYIESERERN